jgi:hypothetical protein
MRTVVASLVLLALSSSPSFATTLGFEDLPLNQHYDLDGATPGNPSSFVTGGVNVSLSLYYYSASGTTTSGSARVANGGSAGGSGQEMWLSNVNLNFDFGAPVASIQLCFGEFGGNINLQVNGDQRIADDLKLLPATIGGVAFSTSGTNTPGSTLSLTGHINSFSIGGQEFAIDNVSYQVPEPSTIVLLGLTLPMLLVVRRRLA